LITNPGFIKPPAPLGNFVSMKSNIKYQKSKYNKVLRFINFEF